MVIFMKQCVQKTQDVFAGSHGEISALIEPKSWNCMVEMLLDAIRMLHTCKVLPPPQRLEESKHKVNTSHFFPTVHSDITNEQVQGY